MIVAVFGGTFDPPHLGHLRLALAALESGAAQKVLLIPASIPPHKHRPDISAPAHRLAMTRLLAESDPRLTVSDIELLREGPSFTIDTIRALQALNPDTQYRLLIGADMALYFGSWKDAEVLIELAPPIVAERPGAELPRDFFVEGPQDLSSSARAVIQAGRIPMEPISLSSTDIRNAVLAQTLDDGILLPGVRAYIEEYQLYQTQG